MRPGIALMLVPFGLVAQAPDLFEKLPQTWYDAYLEGQRLLKQNRPKEAQAHFQQALRLSRKGPGSRVTTYGNNQIDYHPYLGLARAALALGDLPAARTALEQSARAGGEPADQRRTLEEELARRSTVKVAAPPATRPADTAPAPRAPETKPAADAPAPERRVDPPATAPVPLPAKTVPETAEPQPPSRKPSPGAPTRIDIPGTEAPKPIERVAASGPPSAPDPSTLQSPQPTIRKPWAWTAGGGLLLLSALLAFRRFRRRNPYGVDLRASSSRAAKGAGAWVEPSAVRAPQPTHLGPFRVLEPLGRGGCATTYLAVHERTGQKAALKVPHPHVMVDADFRARFWREAALGQLLDHPRIPRILEVGSEEDPWLAQAFVAGITLEEHLREVVPLPISQAIHIALDVAEALSHAHAKGVVHRDLKPSNIMLGEGGALVLDFGIARVVDTANTATALLLGTPAYFAPEGLQSARVGPAADRYALGILLFEMLTSGKPFTGDNPFHILEQHRTAPLPDLHELRPEAPPRLVRLVERLCQKEPSERPEDLEVLEILRNLKAAHPL